jgi:hypothetical protein
VEITFMGQVREIGYETDGKTLKIINPNAGETQVFTIDSAGCFDGGGLIGTYCKADGIAAALSGRGLTGTWEAKAPGGSFRLTFAEDNKVKLTVADDGGTPESQEASYAGLRQSGHRQRSGRCSHPADQEWPGSGGELRRGDHHLLPALIPCPGADRRG